MVNTCSHCGTTFVPKFANAKLCYACYMKRERALAEYDWLQSELRRVSESLSRALADNWTLQTEKQQAAPIPPDILRKLIVLAHPDKHDNSKVATEVTTWLLQQRRASA